MDVSLQSFFYSRLYVFNWMSICAVVKAFERKKLNVAHVATYQVKNMKASFAIWTFFHSIKSILPVWVDPADAVLSLVEGLL